MTASTLSADLDSAGDVDQHDLAVFIRAYGSSAGQPAFNELCDLNDDDRVALGDADRFIGIWLKGE